MIKNKRFPMNVLPAAFSAAVPVFAFIFAFIFVFIFISIFSSMSVNGFAFHGGQAGNSGGFQVEPYLLDVTPESAVVAFHLTRPMSAYVNVFDSRGAREFHSKGSGPSHFISITGLQPGMSYRYQVVCGSGDTRTPPGDDSYRIRTACRPGEYFTFAVFGDPRPGDNQTSRHHAGIIRQIVNQEPVFHLILGDMVDDGRDPAHWNEFFKVESPLMRRSAAYPVIGDNDHAGGKGIYTNYFPRLKQKYYRFQWGGVHFFGLYAWNTRGDQPKSQFDSGSPQYKWFQEEMSKPEVRDAPFRVVFVHDPVYVCRGRASETLKRTWEPLFEKHNVDVVFASWHLYERSQSNGITYVISGGGGAELIWMKKNPAYPSQVDARQYHFCRVDVNDGSMTIRGIAVDGTVLDSITLTPREKNRENTAGVRDTALRLGETIMINKQDPEIPEVPLLVFAYDCKYCRTLLNRILPRMARQKNIAFRVVYYDLKHEGTYDLFLNAGAQFGRQGAGLPAVFMGRAVMGGQREIETQLPGEIESFLKDPDAYRAKMIRPFTGGHDTKKMGESAFSALTLGVVLGAGLLDGINPCAFTTIIFLISYLSIGGASRQRMLTVGGVFTFAVFITYFIIGLVFFNVAGGLLENRDASLVVNILLLLMLITLAVLSFKDYLKCRKGKAGEMTLQLPGVLKKNIRERIRHFARRKGAMIGVTFVLGVVIAAMELTCTGQVYLPIVTMISEPQHRVTAIFYLFIYNLAFILPLIAVFLLVSFGLTSQKVSQIFQRHVAAVKLGFTALFAVMAMMIILQW